MRSYELDDRFQAFLSHGAIAGLEVMWDFAAELQARPPEDPRSRELTARYMALLSAFHEVTAGIESGVADEVAAEQVVRLQIAAGNLLLAQSEHRRVIP